MNLKVAVICLSVLVTGCSQTLPEPTKVEKIHPSWPDPIKAYDGKWQVKVIDGKAWVGMPFEESQKYRSWMDDISRYVHDSNDVICYYRTELKESKCVK